MSNADDNYARADGFITAVVRDAEGDRHEAPLWVTAEGTAKI